jgi:hypothetical protein
MTQTRPANLFGNSPLDSPHNSDASQLNSAFRSYSAPGSASQMMTQTQLDATQTPTQASKDPTRLRRTNALVGYESYESIAATEQETQDTGMDDEESFPSAAQPAAKNVFDIMRAAATQKPLSPEVVLAGKKHRSAFIENEADMSDEDEGGMGRASGDEDETGLDAELESLVDNEEVDRDVADEQDALVDELFAYVLPDRVSLFSALS